MNINQLIFGRYLPGNSFVHRMDPRAKLLLSFYFVLVVFIANDWCCYLFLALVTLFCIKLSRIKIKVFINGLKPLFVLILITILMQLFFTSGGHIYWQWGIFTLTSNGIISSVLITVRFILIIFMSTLLTLTTTPIAIADAMTALLRPLARFHLPVDEIGLMLSIALRMVPTLADEATQVMAAQHARGVDFNHGNLFKRGKALISLLIPMFVDSFNQATNLATAMEARGYQSGKPRTHYHQLHWQKTDTMALIVMLLIIPILVFLRK